MLTRKCDICGAEMRMTTPRYKVTFDGWLYTKEIDICADCFNRIAGEIKQADTPQTETKTETQNSNLTFEKRTMRDCYNCKKYETEGECIECHYEPKDEPQTCSVNGRPYSECGSCEHFKCTADEPKTNKEIVLDPSFAELSDEQFVAAMKLIEPQTDCPWK